MNMQFVEIRLATTNLFVIKLHCHMESPRNNERICSYLPDTPPDLTIPFYWTADDVMSLTISPKPFNRFNMCVNLVKNVCY